MRLYRCFSDSTLLSQYTRNLGLSGAGKTTIQDKLLNVEHSSTPNLGDNAKEQSIKKYNVSVQTRKSREEEQRDYFNEVLRAGRTVAHPIQLKIMDAIVFVVDSTNTSNINTVRYELQTSLQESRLIDVVFLILANKQDLPGALSVKEISKVLELHKMKQEGSVVPAIFGTSALTGEGIHEAAEWLFNALDKKKLKTEMLVRYQRKRPRNEERDMAITEPSNKIQKPQMAMHMAEWIQKAKDYASVNMWQNILPKG